MQQFSVALPEGEGEVEMQIGDDEVAAAIGRHRQ